MSRTVILGASPKPERYSYKVMQRLLAAGEEVDLVNPNYAEIEGRPVLPGLDKVRKDPDTLTVYLNPDASIKIIDKITDLNPGRVILNPGSYSGELENALKEKGLSTVEACSLVMLSTGQY